VRTNIRPSQDNDIDEVVTIRNRVSPDMIPLTSEDLRHQVSAAPERAHSHQFVAEYGGTIAGFSLVRARWWTDDPSRFTLTLFMDPALQGRGIGSTLYIRTEDAARNEGAAMLYTWVREGNPGAMAFAERRGYVPTGVVDRPSRLHVPTARLDAAHEVIEGGSIRMVSLADLGTGDDVLRQLHTLDETTARDVPSSDMWVGSSFDEWKSHVYGTPGVRPEGFWVALDGERPIGLTWLEVHGSAASTGYTGVDRAYRGRGIGRALKTRITRWARESGIEWIYTFNDASNAGMLAINVGLGFQFLPARLEMAKTLER
jgi:mycothiol synthase